MHHEGVAPTARATPHRLLEVGSAAHPVRSGQHRRRGQAESSARPLRRRAERIARPARVRIRRRKPWVFARRRLFGWNVRLVTRVSNCLSRGPRDECVRPGPCAELDCSTHAPRAWANAAQGAPAGAIRKAA
jgi:hypothetical protein